MNCNTTGGTKAHYWIYSMKQFQLFCSCLGSLALGSIPQELPTSFRSRLYREVMHLLCSQGNCFGASQWAHCASMPENLCRAFPQEALDGVVVRVLGCRAGGQKFKSQPLQRVGLRFCSICDPSQLSYTEYSVSWKTRQQGRGLASHHHVPRLSR